MTPFESAVRGSLEGSRGDRSTVHRPRRTRSRRPRDTTIGDTTVTRSQPANSGWSDRRSWNRGARTERTWASSRDRLGRLALVGSSEIAYQKMGERCEGVTVVSQVNQPTGADNADGHEIQHGPVVDRVGRLGRRESERDPGSWAGGAWLVERAARSGALHRGSAGWMVAGLHGGRRRWIDTAWSPAGFHSEPGRGPDHRDSAGRRGGSLARLAAEVWPRPSRKHPGLADRRRVGCLCGSGVLVELFVLAAEPGAARPWPGSSGVPILMDEALVALAEETFFRGFLSFGLTHGPARRTRGLVPLASAPHCSASCISPRPSLGFCRPGRDECPERDRVRCLARRARPARRQHLASSSHPCGHLQVVVLGAAGLASYQPDALSYAAALAAEFPPAGGDCPHLPTRPTPTRRGPAPARPPTTTRHRIAPQAVGKPRTQDSAAPGPPTTTTTSLLEPCPHPGPHN